jgi:hypothetical protein
MATCPPALFNVVQIGRCGGWTAFTRHSAFYKVHHSKKRGLDEVVPFVAHPVRAQAIDSSCDVAPECDVIDGLLDVDDGFAEAMTDGKGPRLPYTPCCGGTQNVSTQRLSFSHRPDGLESW